LLGESPLLIDTTLGLGNPLQSTDCATSRGKNKNPFEEMDDGILPRLTENPERYDPVKCMDKNGNWTKWVEERLNED
jgi:hypothetical protein